MSQENSNNMQPLIRYANRQQMSWRAVDVERLIGEDHSTRAIWALVGRLDLRQFYEGIEEGGRPAFDPQLLISLWVYAFALVARTNLGGFLHSFFLQRVGSASYAEELEALHGPQRPAFHHLLLLSAEAIVGLRAVKEPRRPGSR
jgi:hypothetical protein